MSEHRAAFALEDVTFAYGAGEPALRGATLDVRAGELTSVIGPNGAGKSTIIRLLGGALRPGSGRVRCLGDELGDWDRRALARRLAVLSQESPPGLPLTVQEYVELGRSPYVGPWSALSAEDHDAIEIALTRVGLEGLRNRALSDLSGGERQRAKLARALAQDPDLLLLDEPTAFLDIGHALWTFEAMRRLVDERDVTVLCVTHDVHLASRFSDRVIVVSAGRVTATGRPADVLTSDTVSAAYDCAVQIEDAGALGRYVLPVRTQDPIGASL